MSNVRQIETIVAKYVNPKKPNGKFASIKTLEGVMYMAEPHVIAGVQPNQTITIDFERQNWGQGAEKKLVNVIVRVLDEAPRTAGTQAPQPSPQHPAQPSYRSKTQEESCEIFINGYLQYCFQGTGQVPPAHIMAHNIYSLRCAWWSGMAKPLTVVKIGEPTIPVPTPERPTTPATKPIPSMPSYKEQPWPGPAFDEEEIPL